MFDEDFDYITPDYDNEYEEPESWTLISALDRVLSVVLEERLSNNFWEKAKNPIDRHKTWKNSNLVLLEKNFHLLLMICILSRLPQPKESHHHIYMQNSISFVHIYQANI